MQNEMLSLLDVMKHFLYIIRFLFSDISSLGKLAAIKELPEKGKKVQC